MTVCSEDRAVSDLTGFAVVFGIVVLSVGLTYTLGVGALTDVQGGEAFDNADRAFDIVADNMADIHRNGAPSRSTELDFGGGELAMGSKVTLTVRDRDTGSVLGSFTAISIQYRNREQGIHYAGGAVVRSARDSATIVTDPPFRFGSDRTVFSFVDTKSAGETASISGGSVRVTGRMEGRSVVAIERNPSLKDYNVTVTSPRFRAWQRYFERQGLTCPTVDPASDTVVCDFQTEALFIRRTQIGIFLTP